MTPDREHKKGGERLSKTAESSKKSGKAKGGKHQAKRSTKERVLRSIFLAVTILSAIIVVLFAIYKLLVVEPELSTENRRPPKGPVQSLAPGETQDPAAVTNPDRKSPHYYTILVAGRDTGGGGNTDVIMLVSYDVSNQKLNVMNIPRDTMVNKPWDIKKINSVYNYAGGGTDGVDALRETVADTTGVYPDFYVMVEWEAVGRLAQAVGGVEFDVPLNMYYDDPYQDLHIHINKGLQTLNGDQVMKVLRFRKNNDGSGYASGDIGRIETQQKLLKAIAGKLLTPATITRLPELVDIFADNVETDLSIQNLLWFGNSALEGGLSMDNVNFVTLPAQYNGFFYSYGEDRNESYVFPYVDQVLELVNADFNPYKVDVTEADLDIMYKNSDGSIAATSGTVQDGRANPAYWEWLSRPKDTPDPEASEDPEDPDDDTEDPVNTEDPDATREPEDPDDTGRPDHTRDPDHSSAPVTGGQSNENTPPPGIPIQGGQEENPVSSPEGPEEPNTNLEPTPEPLPEPTPEPEPQPADPEGPPQGIPF